MPARARSPPDVFALKKETSDIIRRLIKERASKARIEEVKAMRKRMLDALLQGDAGSKPQGTFGGTGKSRRKGGWGN